MHSNATQGCVHSKKMDSWSDLQVCEIRRECRCIGDSAIEIVVTQVQHFQMCEATDIWNVPRQPTVPQAPAKREFNHLPSYQLNFRTNNVNSLQLRKLEMQRMGELKNFKSSWNRSSLEVFAAFLSSWLRETYNFRSVDLLPHDAGIVASGANLLLSSWL